MLILITIDEVSTKNLENQDTIQDAVDYCLHIQSFSCTKYLFKKLTKLKIEVVIGIRSLSEIIYGWVNNNQNDSSIIDLSVSLINLKF